MENIIEIRGLKKHFGQLEVLNDIRFGVAQGEVICLIGASGSGKSTLLRCINLLETPDAGEILVHGQDILRGRMDVNGTGPGWGWSFSPLTSLATWTC